MLLLAVAAVVVVTARDDGAESEALTVLAASSLADVLPALDPRPAYSFAGTNALASQIANGVPADVLLSANTSIPEALYAKGLVERPVVFTRNALVLVVPKGNPAGIRGVSDLARPGTSVVVAGPDVPVGAYTLEVLRRLGLDERIRPNIASRETDVRSVLAKIQLGQGDAGFVYATDARTAPDDVDTIELPASAQPDVDYALAVVSRSRHRRQAKAFVAEVRGREGQAAFARYGFRPL